MVDAARDDDELTRLDDEFMFFSVLAYTHAQRTFHDEKQLILGIMVMPDEVTLDLDDFHVEIVDLADDLGLVLLGEQGKLLGKIDFLNSHGHEVLDSTMPELILYFATYNLADTCISDKGRKLLVPLPQISALLLHQRSGLTVAVLRDLFRRNNGSSRQAIAFFQVQQAHALGRTAGFADVLGVDADDLAELADHHHL